MRFLVGFTAARPEAREEEADDFAEAFLGFLLNLAGARDKAVRFRTCQIVAGVLNALGADAEISDDLYERMEEVMLERLRDKCAAVRAQAARALSRLQDGGDGGDFSDDKRTQAFLTLLGAEKQPQVRKAILGSLAISDHTIPHVVERTRDAADDVRRVAYLALAGKVPVASVTIALRASAVRRGLAERSPSVRAAAVEMLKRWHLAFEGDALALLAALDAESERGGRRGGQGAHRVRKDQARRGGCLRRRRRAPRRGRAATPPRRARGGRADPSVLMTPEAAVYWRVVCEALHASATQSGATAASAVGQNQVVSAAVHGERLESLEAALPASAADLLALVAAHADAGAVFVARQLLPLLSLLDLADATARRGARRAGGRAAARGAPRRRRRAPRRRRRRCLLLRARRRRRLGARARGGAPRGVRARRGGRYGGLRRGRAAERRRGAVAARRRATRARRRRCSWWRCSWSARRARARSTAPPRRR